jgi:hypothetical protein
MSIEQQVFVKVPEAARDAVAELDRRSEGALARITKAPLGDRTDILRFERLQTELELLATIAMNDGAEIIPEDVLPVAQSGSCIVRSVPDGVAQATAKRLHTWLNESVIVIAVAAPFVVGSTNLPAGTGKRKPVAETWETKEGNRGKEATYERFAEQLATAVSPKNHNQRRICPSGIPNVTLTKGLRAYAATVSGQLPVLDVPVIYRDGSTARPFPLRCIPLIDNRETMGRNISFSLLSIRHVDLDVEVDGAWLRNSEVSRPRPAADTDEFVYQESVKQLDRLCDMPTTLVMYQTGLETAITGFYRAVAERLMTYPNTLSVLPMFYQERGPYLAGQAWRVA